MVCSDIYAGLSDINTKLYTTNMYQFKQDVSKEKLQIEGWTNEIFISRETYYKIVGQKLNLYSTSLLPVSRNCMYTITISWYENKEFNYEQVR